ncbi:hypothetical protein AA15973_1250 [Komagataeibacter sucrofermentans DSM 15973]|nr:hypothetical protein AA15973_1250 [Komagataeibacter sucrofermentans DSM 15973]
MACTSRRQMLATVSAGLHRQIWRNMRGTWAYTPKRRFSRVDHGRCVSGRGEEGRDGSVSAFNQPMLPIKAV